MTTKPLTIWIPTYRRPEMLAALLDNLQQCDLMRLAQVVISDNDPGGPLSQAIEEGQVRLPAGVTYRCNVANLSAGVNFLRGFECCETPWLMIVGDDDRFEPGAATLLEPLLACLADSVLAVKFDSSLFGQQSHCQATALRTYVTSLQPRHYPAAFNNLCLISNWLFRAEPYRRHLSSAYLGYSSKLSHLFPLLRANEREGGDLLFSELQPVRHGTTEDSSWPKAATWYEMVVTLSTFCGFIAPADRADLLRLLLHSDWRRYVLKCLRIQQFYGDRRQGIDPWSIHAHLAILSWQYGFALLLSLPLLFVPTARLPRRIREKLGDPGRIDRW